MNAKRIFLAFVFSLCVGQLKAAQNVNYCEKAKSKTQAKIKKNFDQLWEKVDSTVGVEFFMVVLQSNNRLPASELSDAEYFRTLLKGMKRTSRELADHGVKFEEKKLKALEGLIDDLAKTDCPQLVSR
jgi:hypothetical protein